MKKSFFIPLSITLLILTCCSNINKDSNPVESIIPTVENNSASSEISDQISENISEEISNSIEPTVEPTVEPTTSEDIQISFTITYDSNGGQGTMDEQNLQSYDFVLNENTYYKPGYNFIGWSLEPNGIVDYVDCEAVTGSIIEDTTLYAIYELNFDKLYEIVDNYSKMLPSGLEEVVAFYGGEGEYDITKYIPSFDKELANSIELQFGKLVYVGTNQNQYENMTANFIPISQSYRNIANISLLDAYLELAYSYYYQGTQIQYDQGSSYQRKIRNMKPEDATDLYQKYMDCSTYVSNAFYNAFDDVVAKNEDLNSITTKVLINYAKDNINKSNEVIIYQDDVPNMSDAEKQTALKEFKDNLQTGDLYVYRHGGDSAGHVMLYVGNGYFLHSTGSSYNYSSLVDKTESWTSVQGEVKPEGTVRYQSASSTIYNESSNRYLFYKTSSDSTDRYALLRPLNRQGLKLTPTTISRCMMSGIDIEKSADKTTSVTSGDYITYTIRIKNNSQKTINNISVNDVIPNNTSFVEMSNDYYYNNDGKNLIWNIPSLNSKNTIKLSYKVKVTDNADFIGEMITSEGQVGNIKLNTLNISISSLTSSDLTDFINLALQYYNNKNVYYDEDANNSKNDPTNNVVTFSNGANFVSTIYYRFYKNKGKTVDLTSELSSVTNSNFMNSIIDKDGNFVENSKLFSMMVNGGYGGTLYTKDYTMDRMRTVREEYLLPGDIISFSHSTATNQYLYLGDITIGTTNYRNALLLFTTSAGVKLVYGSDADELLVKFIGYKRFAVIRPSLYY